MPSASCDALQEPLLNSNAYLTRPLDFNRGSVSASVINSVEILYRELSIQQDFTRMRLGPTKGHLNIILCNLMHAYFALRGSWVRFSRSPSRYRYITRYHPFGCSYVHTTGVVDALSQSELIEFKRGFYYREDGQGKLSIIRAKPALVEVMLGDAGVKPDDVSKFYQRELLILKDGQKQLMEYQETTDTEVIQAELQRYNDCLNAHCIDLVGLGDAQRNILGDYPIDMTRTNYHRVFSNGSLFDVSAYGTN